MAKKPKVGPVGVTSEDARVTIERDKRAAEIVRSCWPRLGALGPAGLAGLNNALQHLDRAAAEAEILLADDRRDAVLTLLIQASNLYRAVAKNPEDWDAPPPSADRVFQLLINALIDLNHGRRSELFEPRATGGAPRLGFADGWKRFWAAVALGVLVEGAGKKLPIASREIEKELGIPRADCGIVMQWRKDLTSGKRGRHLQHMYEQEVASMARWGCAPMNAEDDMPTIRHAGARVALGYAKEYAAEEETGAARAD